MKKQLIASITSLVILSATPYNVLANDSWKNVNVNETNVEQNGSLFNSENYNFVKYSKIEEKLQQVAKESNRVTYEKSTYTSSKGEPMYVVTISDPDAIGKFGYYKGLRKKMLRSPEKAQDFIDTHPDLNVPVMIIGSIHGENITEDTPAIYDISAWSFPELWGFEAVEVNAKDSFNIKTSKVTSIQSKGTLHGNGPYLIPNSSVQSVSLANQLINKGFVVKRDNDGNFYVSADAKSELSRLLTNVDVTVETKTIPSEAEKVERQVVTILRDGGMNKSQSHAGTHLALKRLGFIVEERTPEEIANKRKVNR